MAQRGVNKCILLGNVGKDPEVRYFPNGDPVANFTLATSEVWKDKNTGEPQERTEWHRVSVRGKLAELVKQYVHKGSKLYVEGKLQTRKWQGQDGQDRYTTEIVVDMNGQVQFLDSKSGSQDGQQRDGGAKPGVGQGAGSQAPPRGSHEATGASGGGGGGDFNDDIPFGSHERGQIA